MNEPMTKTLTKFALLPQKLIGSGTTGKKPMDLPKELTLRDYFAAAALPTLLSMPTPPAWVAHSEEWRGQCAAEAYLIADAMLAEREKS